MPEFNVVVKMKVLPTGVDVDLEKIKEGIFPIINRIGKVHSSKIEPIAFGLNSLDVTILLDDSEGGMDKLEREISNVPYVGEVSVVDINRI